MIKSIDYQKTCDENGLQPLWLARQIGISSRNTVSYWCRGIRKINDHNVDKLKKWLESHNFKVFYKKA